MNTTTPKKTFTAHGFTWIEHKPGDPMPCDPKTIVEILLREELQEEFIEPCLSPASDWCWDVLPDSPDDEIIGWRYADKQEQPVKPASPWRPIADAPKDSTPVDIWSRSNGRLANYSRVHYGGGNYAYDPVEDGVTTVRDATHFMPLPEPPQD